MDLNSMMDAVYKDAISNGCDVLWWERPRSGILFVSFFMDDEEPRHYRCTNILKMLELVQKEVDDNDTIPDAFWKVMNSHYQI